MTDIDIELATASSHSLLTCELFGDTLIVSPQGDLAGFSRTLFDVEQQRVRRLLASRGIRNLLIDLSGGQYFGRAMISALLDLRSSLPEEGAVAFAEPSNDMRLMMERTDMADGVPLFATRRDALRRIARRNIGHLTEKLRGIAVPVGIAVCILLGWGLLTQTRVFARWVGTPESRIYCAVLDCYHEAIAVAGSMPTHREWKKTSESIDAALFSILEQLKAEGDEQQGRKQLQEATAAVWQQTRTSSPPTNEQQAMMQAALVAAKVEIERDTGLTLATPLERVERRSANPILRQLPSE